MFNILLFTVLFISARLDPFQSQHPAAADTSSIASVSFCDLIKHPDLYSGKIVTTVAGLAVGMEGSIFFDDSCKQTTGQEDVIAMATFTEESYKTGASLHKKLNKVLRKNRKNVALVKVIGLFSDGKSRTFGHQNCCRFKLEVRQLLQVDDMNK